jgi:plastocyanin
MKMKITLTTQKFPGSIRAGWCTSVAMAALVIVQAVGATWDVSIQNFAFTPKDLTIKAGDTVRWTQKDAITHTSTSGPNGVADGIWDSGNMTLAANTTFSFTFDTAGTFPYFCRPHKSTMRGSITVEAAAQPPSIQLVNPTNGAVFIEPAAVTLLAEAVEGGSPLANVTFFSNATQVAEITVPPYTLTLNNLAAGTYAFSAQVMDSAGQQATSVTATVTVQAPAAATLSALEPAGSLGWKLAWTGGTPPFLIQTKTVLNDPAWMDLATTSENAMLVARSSEAGYYRVLSHTEKTVTSFTAVLNGAAERPDPVDTTATGFGWFALSGNTLAVSVRYSGLSGPATGAHIHGIANTTQSGGVIVPLTVPASAAGTIAGLYDVTGLTAEQRDALLHGRTYVNIHTGNHKAGEIRGQVAPVVWAATLSGAAERPTPVETSASGYGAFWLVGNEFTYDVDYDGLSSAATMAHLHGPADAENSASVLQGFQVEGALGLAGAFSGRLTLSPAQLGAVVDGLTYANVHSQNHGAGELRGQVLP